MDEVEGHILHPSLLLLGGSREMMFVGLEGMGWAAQRPSPAQS